MTPDFWERIKSAFSLAVAQGPEGAPDALSEGAQPARAHVGDDTGGVWKSGLQLRSHYLGYGKANAFVRDVHNIDASALLEKLAGEVCQVTGTS